MKWKHKPPNQWDVAKVVLEKKLLAIETYFKNQEKSQVNNLIFHLHKLEQEQGKFKVNLKKEIKIRVEINRDKKIENNDETKSWFLEKKNKTDKPLSRHIKKKKREEVQINKI